MSAASLSITELNYIADTLGGLVDEFWGHSSSDWFVPDTPEGRAIIAATIAYDAQFLEAGDEAPFEDIIESGGELFIFDYQLMRYLAHRCKTVALASLAGEPARLAETETLRIVELMDMLQLDWARLFEQDFEVGCEDDSLPLTEENKALVAEIIRYANPADLQVHLNHAAEASGETVRVFSLWALRYLVQRCQATKGAVRAPSAEAIAALHAAKVDSAPKVAPLGVAKGWNTEKSLVKKFKEWDTFAEVPETADKELAAYGSGENPFQDYFDKTKPVLPPFAMRVDNVFTGIGQWERRAFAIALYSHEPEASWMPHLEKATGYWYWKQRIDGISSTAGVWKSTRALRDYMEVIADCLVLGWIEEAKSLTDFVYELYLHNRFMDVAGKGYNDPLAHWLLRICFDHWGRLFSCWGNAAVNVFHPDECLGKPVLNELVANWKQPDLSAYADHILWLCDFHTHSHPGGLRKATRYPALILAWFRLRELQGLSNPQIDHPLMRADYVKLPAPRPFYSDPLLTQVLARLRVDEIAEL